MGHRQRERRRRRQAAERILVALRPPIVIMYREDIVRWLRDQLMKAHGRVLDSAIVNGEDQ